MKKGTAAILLIFYIAASTGIVINLHYCMSRFDTLQLGASKTEVCGKCGMLTKSSNGCCHDQVKIIKLQDDQQLTSISFRFNAPVATDLSVLYFINEAVFTNINKLALNNHSPPLSKQDTYLQNCVFRI